MGTLAVYQCLSECIAPNPAVQRPAEEKLRQWEGQPGFSTCLVVRLSAAARKVELRRHLRPARVATFAPNPTVCGFFHFLFCGGKRDLLSSARSGCKNQCWAWENCISEYMWRTLCGPFLRQEIVSSTDPAIAQSVKLLAAVCLKNAINRFWRPRRGVQCAPSPPKPLPSPLSSPPAAMPSQPLLPPTPSPTPTAPLPPARRGVPDAEKAQLRAALVPLAAAEDHQVSLHVALAVARVARFDYPREWRAPTLQPTPHCFPPPHARHHACARARDIALARSARA